jgi:hypothetical protein
MLIIKIAGHVELEILASLFQMLFGSIFPFIIILGCNVIIITTVKSASANRTKLSSGKGQGQEKRKEEQHLTRMLVFVSFVYVVTSIPYRMYILLMLLPAIAEIYKMEETYWNLRYLVEILSVFNVWMYNYAINFYLYCLGGGEKYRRDTVDVCKRLVSSCSKVKVI